MKKSNKLLLGGLLTLLLLISAIHVSLYAKYKNGNYTIFRSEDEQARMAMQAFPGVKTVYMRNVQGAVISFGDVAEVEKGTAISSVQRGDSLVIAGLDDDQPGRRINVRITLPSNATLSFANSSLAFEPSRKTSDNNTVIYMQKSYAVFMQTNLNFPFRLGHVKIAASDGSQVAFQGDTHVRVLETELMNSTLENNAGTIDSLSIASDTTSRISLHSKLLLKAKIIPILSKP